MPLIGAAQRGSGYGCCTHGLHAACFTTFYNMLYSYCTTRIVYYHVQGQSTSERYQRTGVHSTQKALASKSGGSVLAEPSPHPHTVARSFAPQKRSAGALRNSSTAWRVGGKPELGASSTPFARLASEIERIGIVESSLRRVSPGVLCRVSDLTCSVISVLGLSTRIRFPLYSRLVLQRPSVIPCSRNQ